MANNLDSSNERDTVALSADTGSPQTRLDTADLSGHGLNLMCREADASHRLLNFVPTPTWECIGSGAGSWAAGFSLSPATENWAERVRNAESDRLSQAVGVVGATSAGKSWLIGNLQSVGSARPSRLEEQFDGVTLQSMTSDINLYIDPVDHIYYIDFEGMYGTQPLLLGATPEGAEVMKKCPSTLEWEAKRRTALKESFQPAIAYLTCNVVIFVTREKLVCRRALEECEQFAQAANGRVISALPPALILIQNCCRPSEGIFDTTQCTSAFLNTHLGNDFSRFQKYFRSIDCFCVPDECLTCKRTGFDGEEVCKNVLASLKRTLRVRLEEDTSFRLRRGVRLSQVQWFSVLSTLCSLVNDRETVQMASIYVHANATNDGLGELKSALMQLMTHNLHIVMNVGGAIAVRSKLEVAFGMIARFVVRRELSREETEQIIAYLLALFPCGGTVATSKVKVQRFDSSKEPVTCGQMNMFHEDLHRSGCLVRTVEAHWWQGVSEWFQGGVTHCWEGEFVCHEAFREFDDLANLSQAIHEDIEGYKLERCLEGLHTLEVGIPWVVKAHGSLSRAAGRTIRRDTTRMCVVCMAKGVPPTFFQRMFLLPEGHHLPACDRCYEIMEKHGLCGPDLRIDNIGMELVEQRCEVCAVDLAWSRVSAHRQSPGGSSGASGGRSGQRSADHRLLPCKCVVCGVCAEKAYTAYSTCPLCTARVRWMVDERALVMTGWRAAAVRPDMRHGESEACACIGRTGKSK